MKWSENFATLCHLSFDVRKLKTLLKNPFITRDFFAGKNMKQKEFSLFLNLPFL